MSTDNDAQGLTDRVGDQGDIAVTVLVPTRNEGDNVNRLLLRLAAHFAETGRSYEVLFVDDSDRQLLRATIAAQDEACVLVTHGTDSMVETARVLAGIEGKTIVLTGALSPARFEGSDAEFNIGCAVGAVQSLPPGTYIAMNGRIWDPLKVRKNVDANRFEAIG